MIPHPHPLTVSFPHFPHPSSHSSHSHSISHPHPVQTSSITFAPPISNIQGVVITQLPSIPSNPSLRGFKSPPQIGINIISPVIREDSSARLRPTSQIVQGMSSNRNSQKQLLDEEGFDIQKEQLKDEVKRLQGLLRKNQVELESVRRELTGKNQSLIEFERRLISGQSNQTIIHSQFKSIQQQNLKLKSIIQRMTIDRQSLVKSHEKYMKNDDLARTEIFSQVQKLQKTIQIKTKELSECKQREIMFTKQFQMFKNQAGNKINDGERNTMHLMEKLKVALEGKELQIESLNQAIQQLDGNLSVSEKSNSENIYKIRQLESYIQQILSQNTNLKQYQNHRQHQITFQANNQLSILRTQAIQLQHHLQVYKEKEKQVMSTYAGVTEKDNERLKMAIQEAESNQLTMQYLSKEINNYRLIIQDLESYKENGYKKDVEIARLHQIIVNKEKELVESEGVSEELRVRLKGAERNYHSTYQRSEETIRSLEEKSVGLNRRIEVLEAEKVGLGQVESAHADIHISELTKALDLSRNEYFSLRKTSDEKIFELQAIRADLENQFRSITMTIQQKQSEKMFFQTQYKTLYSQFLETKKYSSTSPDFNLHQLKQRLFDLQSENTQLLRALQFQPQPRPTFNTADQLSRARNTIDKNNRKTQQHHRQTQSMTGLREENEHLKLLLEDAQRKIEEYAGDLDECQHRMGVFQARMENLLGGGNGGGSGRQVNGYNEYVHEQRQVMEQVQELKNKLKAFKKQNEQLKRKVKESKDENKRVRKESKSKQKDGDNKRHEGDREKIIEQHEQIIKQNKLFSKKTQQITYQIEVRNNHISQLTQTNNNLTHQLNRITEINIEHQHTLKQYEKNISQYEQAINKHEARIKDYQTHMLKIKHKYKEEANMRLPEPEIERPTNSIQNVSERLEFFRNKSQQAEERVKHLLKINTELNSQLEQTSSLIGGENLNTHKIQLLESNVNILEKKLMATSQENLELKARMETADDTNVSRVLQIKIRQLMEENSELGVQISQAHSEIFNLKQQNQILEQSQSQGGHSESGDIEKFKYLEQKFQSLNQLIYSLESEKQELQHENTELKLRSTHQTTIENQNIFLQQISDLQHEVYQLKVSKRELQLQLQQLSSHTHTHHSPTPQGLISMQTYSILMIQVDKLIQYTDHLNSVFGNIVDVIARTEIEQLKLAIDGFVSDAGELFKAIDMIKYSLGGLRQQSETAVMIHEMNQII